VARTSKIKSCCCRPSTIERSTMKVSVVSSLQRQQHVWLITVLLLIGEAVKSVTSFGVMPNKLATSRRTFLHHPSDHFLKSVSDAADEAEERILARIRKRGRRDRFKDEEEEYDEREDQDAYYQEDDDTYWNEDDAVSDDEEEYTIDWEDEEEKEYDLLENVIIPNPLLDSIDPDGAADRFPELASDPRFWIDMALFIAFLNFLSSAGPRDPFPDLPWY